MYSFEEDRMGGIVLYRGSKDIGYLQPGDDADQFLTNAGFILSIWTRCYGRKKDGGFKFRVKPFGPWTCYEEHISSFVSHYDVE